VSSLVAATHYSASVTPDDSEEATDQTQPRLSQDCLRLGASYCTASYLLDSTAKALVFTGFLRTENDQLRFLSIF
jgi:hypothetical protein